VGIVVIYLQSLVDQIPVPELIVRLTLWTWVVMNYAILVTLIVNTLFLPIEPARQLKEEIHRQLGEVDAALLRARQRTEHVPPPVPGQALAGMLTLQKLLKFAAMRDKQYRADQAYQLALIASVSRLERDANELPAATDGPTPLLAASIEQLRRECAALDGAVQAGARYRLATAPPAPAPAAAAVADDMWRTLGALSALGVQEAAPDKEEAHEDPMVAPDAFRNPAYGRFALKALLAVLIGYVFYNAVQWQGIHTIMLTCLIVALPSLGASTQKAVLRVGGALVGSALALSMVVFVFPRIDSIVGLLLMALPVIGLGAWIAAGSERISYAGIQVTFTFALAVLERFGPSTDLTEIRDRLVGILLGVMLAVAVQTLIWPEGEGETLRRRLAALIRSVAASLRDSTQARQQMRVWTEFAATQAMLARVAIEPDWSEGANELVTVRTQAVLSGVAEIIQAGAALQDQLAVRSAVADELERYAAALEADPPAACKPAIRTFQALQPMAPAAHDLVRKLAGLPDWMEPASEPAAVGAPLRQ
jgi:multidrug resistance protein MdtO